MPAVNRRELLRLLTAAPLAAGFTWTDAEVAAANEFHQAAQAAVGTGYVPKFFTAHEWETVGVLADLILPRDERSGSASEVGVPEFMDLLMQNEPVLPQESRRQTAMRGGLAWLDLECQGRFDQTFVGCSETERSAVLDDISWPVPASDALPPVPDLAPGRAFFFSFRDLTASGFWTTKAGMTDLQFMGNRVVTEWTGCPDEALTQLGVTARDGPPKPLV